MYKGSYDAPAQLSGCAIFRLASTQFIITDTCIKLFSYQSVLGMAVYMLILEILDGRVINVWMTYLR